MSQKTPKSTSPGARQDEAPAITALRARMAAESREHVVLAADDVRTLIEALDDATRERDAYRRAKAENDERFMRERDDARRERDDARLGLDLVRSIAAEWKAEAAERGPEDRILTDGAAERVLAAVTVGDRAAWPGRH